MAEAYPPTAPRELRRSRNPTQYQPTDSEWLQAEQGLP
jgi:hypothetical protein